MIRFTIAAIAATAALAPCAVLAADEAPDAAPYAERFNESKTDLGPTGKNPFFSLERGNVQRFEGVEDGKKTELVITVLDETRKVDGVETRIVEERESQDGDLIEVSRNYFAISRRTNSVYYFGEDSKKIEKGKVVSTEGSWEAGVKGAKYGLIMAGTPLPGARYQQEVAEGVAMDRSEVVNTAETIKVPAGDFKDCIRTRETTPLEPKTTEFKVYAPGPGLVKDGALELVKHETKTAKAK